MKLTAKRISKLRKKIIRYKLFTVGDDGKFHSESRYRVLWGLNTYDALNRFCNRLNRHHIWMETDFDWMAVSRIMANHALLPYKSDRRQDVVWVFIGHRL